MKRREFMSTSLGAAGAALASGKGMSAQPALVRRQFYELRCYSLDMTPGMATVTQSYLADALIPALGRIGIGPVGAFRLDYGPETPAIYVLIPAFSVEELVGLPQRLAQDPAYVKAAAAFDTLTTGRPAFHRIQSSLLRAFEGFPMLHVPARGPRIFQMRTYEAPSPAALERKIEMFHHGEFEVFKNAGCEAIFYSETIFGTRMPSLTYMLTFKDLAALTAGWSAFSSAPAWQKLKADPRYGTDTLVSNITNLVLSPLEYSQI